MVEVFFPMMLFAWVMIYLASFWILMKKSGYPGWFAFVPLLNLYTLTKIAGRSGWWTLGLLVPLLNIAIYMILWSDIGERFGKSPAFSVGLACLNGIFLPMLAFSDAKLGDPIDPYASRQWDLPTDVAGYKTFVNKDGDTVEEIPLEDWD